MNGIEKITEKIRDDTQKEIDAVLNEARAKAAAVTAKYEAQGRAEAAEILEKGKHAAAEHEERLISVAQLECRKDELAAKQEVVEEAFTLARKKLRTLPRETMVELLSNLAVQASDTGREALIFSQEDRESLGREVVAAANAKLAKASAPELPEEIGSSKMGALLDKVVSGASALISGTAMLTLSEETRPIGGGFILSDGAVEVNCSFETLIRLLKKQATGEVFRVLFQ